MLNEFLISKKIKEGNIKAFEEVFKQYYFPLLVYSFSIVNRKEIAEEIVQEFFYKWWKEREKIEISRSIKNYLFRAVRNQSIQYCEHCRVENRHGEKITELSSGNYNISPEDELEIKELEKIISDTLKKLTDRQQNIFKMHRYDGLKYKEIAQNMSLSIKSIEAEMSKAYAVLRKEIEKYNYSL